VFQAYLIDAFFIKSLTKIIIFATKFAYGKTNLLLFF